MFENQNLFKKPTRLKIKISFQIYRKVLGIKLNLPINQNFIKNQQICQEKDWYSKFENKNP